jgi:hypothetical protein
MVEYRYSTRNMKADKKRELYSGTKGLGVLNIYLLGFGRYIVSPVDGVDIKYINVIGSKTQMKLVSG